MSAEGEAIARFVDALDDYAEAARTARRDRTLAPHERKVERQLGVFWRAQKRETVARLRRYRRRFPEADLAEAVTDDEFDRAWAQIARLTAKRLVPVLDKATRQALDAGIAHALAEVGIEVDFDLKNPRAVRWLKDHAAQMVARIDDTTRAGLRDLLTQAGDEGWSWQRTAREIEDRFDGFSKKAAQAHLRTRAELVATSEMADAHGAGNDLVRQHLAALGLDVRKTWHTSLGQRVCPICDGNASVGEIAQGESFPGGVDREPQHPACRCVVTTRVVVQDEET